MLTPDVGHVIAAEEFVEELLDVLENKAERRGVPCSVDHVLKPTGCPVAVERFQPFSKGSISTGELWEEERWKMPSFQELHFLSDPLVRDINRKKVD